MLSLKTTIVGNWNFWAFDKMLCGNVDYSHEPFVPSEYFPAESIGAPNDQKGPGRKAVETNLVIFVMVYSSEDQPD